jgi:hypothetical protein
MDRLNTRNILKRKKHKLEGKNYNCVLCNNNIEEIAFNLFFSCPFSQACWRLLGIHWDFDGDFFSNDETGKTAVPTLLYGDLHHCYSADLEAKKQLHL